MASKPWPFSTTGRHDDDKQTVRHSWIGGSWALRIRRYPLHLLDSGPAILDNYISDYALGDYGWLSRVADVAMAVGLVGIAFGLREALGGGKRVTASWVPVLMAGIGFVISGVFNTDPADAIERTTSGALHDLGGYVSIMSLFVAAWLLRGVMKRDNRLQKGVRVQTWFTVLMTGALAAVLTFESLVGLTQRVFVVVVATWLIFVAAKLRKTTQSRCPPLPQRRVLALGQSLGVFLILHPTRFSRLW